MQFWDMCRTAVLTVAIVIAIPASPIRGQEQTADSSATPRVQLSVTSRVEAGEPVGTAEAFPADVGDVYAVIDVEDGRGETLWIVFGFLGSESLVEMKIEADSERRWTAMAIPSDAKGQWSVSVVHGGGTLTSRMFTVGLGL